MVKKEFIFKGKKLEELQSMSIESLMKLLPSRERRKIKRGFTEQEKKLLSKIAKGKKTTIKTHCR
ncbi:MAG: 30S ribosomal protein S19, partial [Candidatus Woesearchaeota archaeon]|nr:30S ribosomal protein S19 [Candidatus Woesearchaeota archaeon]